MRSDEEGFMYPAIDHAQCIDCHLCERVCPYLSDASPVEPLLTCAAINPDSDERFHSSSGGIFSILARHTIAHKGAVFGAVFAPDWTVCHSVATSESELAPMRGSKYLQSNLGNTFRQVRQLLASDTQVLFTGTQCQVMGLKKFLRKDYPNLITVEVVCHGAPSPSIFKSYLPENTKSVSFRDKTHGWSPSGITVNGNFTFHNNDSFMQSFFSHINMRPSCYSCPAKGGRSSADLTIGDFWGIQRLAPDLNDNTGVSLVIARTPKGRQIIDALGLNLREFSYHDALAGNPSLETSVSTHPNRTYFFRQFRKYGFAKAWARTSSTKLINRIFRAVYRKIITH